MRRRFWLLRNGPLAVISSPLSAELLSSLRSDRAARPCLIAISNFMTTYRAVRRHTDAVISLLETYPYDKDFFYDIRDNRSPRLEHIVAAWLLYLNRACWNGLYRVNRKGRFNTPFGRFANPTITSISRTSQDIRTTGF